MDWLTLYNGGTGEIEEKKSRFIATLEPVSSEEEAVAVIAAVKKKYWDAKHNCSAFVIGDKGQITRCSDDGEPSGTAGRPMLDVLVGEHVTNVCAVVTRYFGGTLLGTGGLVRAYSAAVKEGLANSTMIKKTAGCMIRTVCDYNDIGKLQYMAAQKGYHITGCDYADTVTVTMICDDGDRLSADITDTTSGRAVIGEIVPVVYAMIDGKPVIF
ncbi:MAG: YigZ family protein [Lachnospiraceae bacterium]|nr:YigZ family protein [Lachnospiraceae bacterium]